MSAKPYIFPLLRRVLGIPESNARPPKYVEEHAHPNPDIEEFAFWLEETTRTMPHCRDRYEHWRQVAMKAADAGFLRYAGPNDPTESL